MANEHDVEIVKHEQESIRWVIFFIVVFFCVGVFSCTYYELEELKVDCPVEATP